MKDFIQLPFSFTSHTSADLPSSVISNEDNKIKDMAGKILEPRRNEKGTNVMLPNLTLLQ